MSETAVEPEVKKQFKPYAMNIGLQRDGSPVKIYYADFGARQYDPTPFEIKSGVRVWCEHERFTKLKGEPHHNVGSHYVTVIDAPEQPEIVGKKGWLHLHTEKGVDGKWKNTWSTVETSE